MQAVKVQYTVKPEYVEQNKTNIRKVMEALKANPIKGMMYSTYTVEGDDQIFVHINIAQDGATIAKLNEVEAFQAFRKALKASGPVSPPNRTDLNLVAAGFEL